MAKIIKEHKDTFLIFGIGLVLAIASIVSFSGTVVMPNTVSAATTVQQSVAVTATVNEWLTFALSGSGTLSPDLVDASGGTAIASSSVIDLDLGTNANDWSISVTSSAGQLDGSISGSINSPAAASNCTTTAGTDCYGINATSTQGASVDILTLYDYYGTHKMGSVDTSSQLLATSTTAYAAATNVVDFKIEASCDALQSAGSYTDTIYFTATASIP